MQFWVSFLAFKTLFITHIIYITKFCLFADIKEFVSRVADLTADSLTSIMADLPDRDVSDEYVFFSKLM